MKFPDVLIVNSPENGSTATFSIYYFLGTKGDSYSTLIRSRMY